MVQTNPQVSEIMYITMLSTFYNPISYAWSTDNKVTFNPITSVINDQNGFVTINNSTGASLNGNYHTFFMRVKSHQAGAKLQSILISPNYSFDPYTPSASIDYFPDPRTNENINRVSPNDHPMFYLSNDFFPGNYALNQVSLVTNPA